MPHNSPFDRFYKALGNDEELPYSWPVAPLRGMDIPERTRPTPRYPASVGGPYVGRRGYRYGALGVHNPWTNKKEYDSGLKGMSGSVKPGEVSLIYAEGKAPALSSHTSTLSHEYTHKAIAESPNRTEIEGVRRSMGLAKEDLMKFFDFMYAESPEQRAQSKEWLEHPDGGNLKGSVEDTLKRGAVKNKMRKIQQLIIDGESGNVTNPKNRGPIADTKQYSRVLKKQAEDPDFNERLDDENSPLAHSQDILDRGLQRNNADGTHSTFLGSIVTEEWVNDGRPTLIPTFWEGKAYDMRDEDDYKKVRDFVLNSDRRWPSADTIPEALKMEQEIHKSMEKQGRNKSSLRDDRTFEQAIRDLPTTLGRAFKAANDVALYQRQAEEDFAKDRLSEWQEAGDRQKEGFEKLIDGQYEGDGSEILDALPIGGMTNVIKGTLTKFSPLGKIMTQAEGFFKRNLPTKKAISDYASSIGELPGSTHRALARKHRDAISSMSNGAFKADRRTGEVLYTVQPEPLSAADRRTIDKFMVERELSSHRGLYKGRTKEIRAQEAADAKAARDSRLAAHKSSKQEGKLLEKFDEADEMVRMFDGSADNTGSFESKRFRQELVKTLDKAKANYKKHTGSDPASMHAPQQKIPEPTGFIDGSMPPTSRASRGAEMVRNINRKAYLKEEIRLGVSEHTRRRYQKEIDKLERLINDADI